MHNTPTTFITIQTRVRNFFEDILRAPVQLDAQSACDLMVHTLNSIELWAKYYNTRTECPDDHKRSIGLPPISYWTRLPTDPVVYTIPTTKQVLYVADNGSIEIYATEEGRASKIILAKPGYDNYSVSDFYPVLQIA